MGTVTIKIPLVTWRDGRPRYIPGTAARALGEKGQDLRHGDGAWYSLDEAIAWSQAKQQELTARRAAIATGETTPRKSKNALQRARSTGLVTVGQVAETFLDSPRMAGKPIVDGRRKRRPLSANTIRYYRQAARLLEQFDAGRVWSAPADELTPRALAGILELVEIANGLARARSLRAFVSVAFGHGRRQRLVAHDPVAGLEEKLPTLPHRVRPASVAEIETLVATADALGQPDLADLVMAGVWTGQRQNDRLGLPAAAVTGDGILFAPHKKAASAQRLLIPVADPLAPRLEAARRRRRQWPATPTTLFACAATGQAWKADWYRKVYRVVRHAAATGAAETNEAGNPTKDAAAVLGRLDVGAAMAAAGIEPIASLATLRDQDLRDTCLSWAALAGADKFEIAGLSGHAFGQQDGVLRHYVAIPPEFARRAIAKMEAWHAAQLGALKDEAGR